jgi:hypothetical protein
MSKHYLNTENPTLHKNLSAPKESDITIASANLQIGEISDSVIVQSTWPKIFTICSENFSTTRGSSDPVSLIS